MHKCNFAGESQVSLTHTFRLSPTSIFRILNETARAIHKELFLELVKVSVNKYKVFHDNHRLT